MLRLVYRMDLLILGSWRLNLLSLLCFSCVVVIEILDERRLGWEAIKRLQHLDTNIEWYFLSVA